MRLCRLGHSMSNNTITKRLDHVKTTICLSFPSDPSSNSKAPFYMQLSLPRELLATPTDAKEARFPANPVSRIFGDTLGIGQYPFMWEDLHLTAVSMPPDWVIRVAAGIRAPRFSLILLLHVFLGNLFNSGLNQP